MFPIIVMKYSDKYNLKVDLGSEFPSRDLLRGSHRGGSGNVRGLLRLHPHLGRIPLLLFRCCLHLFSPESQPAEWSHPHFRMRLPTPADLIKKSLTDVPL